jgi:hypothetical protein
MKKSAFILFLAFTALTLKAQIVPEYTFAGVSAAFTNLPTAGYKFYAMDVTNSKCILYNTDHSIWKTINLSLPANHYLVDFAYLSEDLFNSDNAIELLYVSYYYDATLAYGTYETRIANESGTVLLSVPGGGYSAVYSAPVGSKLFVWVYDYSTTVTGMTTKVYTIPGQIATSIAPQPEIPGIALQSAFPNPASATVTIPYQLPSTIDEAVLTIYDAQGKSVQSYRIDHTFNNLNIPVNALPSGIYFYRIQAPGFTTESKKLIVNHK